MRKKKRKKKKRKEMHKRKSSAHEGTRKMETCSSRYASPEMEMFREFKNIKQK